MSSDMLEILKLLDPMRIVDYIYSRSPKKEAEPSDSASKMLIEKMTNLNLWYFPVHLSYGDSLINILFCRFNSRSIP